MTEVLAINNLLVQRGGKTVLEIDRLSIPRGSVLAVIGPNGAGKSSLLLALARLLKPTRGEIYFNGKPAAAESDLAYRRRIGLVMQDPLLFDTTVYENVATGLRFRSLPKAAIERRVMLWLERMGIAHLKTRRASELSGGEAQRVSLARAFVLDPELLLLDEPFSALDSPTRSRLLEDLQRILAETSATTVFITHDLGEARRLGQQIAVLLAGRIRQAGHPEQVFASPADDDVARFLGLM
jgi:tungstate transport system ATP-binding protein